MHWKITRLVLILALLCVVLNSAERGWISGEEKENGVMANSNGISAHKRSVTVGSIGGTGGTIISGNAGGSVTQNCNGNNCQTCINGKCFNRNYPAIRMQGMCPATACEFGCIEMVLVGNDNCPFCRCNGFSTREMCQNQKDCLSANGQCVNEICKYPAISGNYVSVCDFSYQCASDKQCDQTGRCVPSANNRRHIENVSCVFSHQCPAGFGDCTGMTCWQGGPDGHVPGVSCVFDHQCPSKYSCLNLTCILTGQDHGTTACVFNEQCASGEVCINLTCKRA